MPETAWYAVAILEEGNASSTQRRYTLARKTKLMQRVEKEHQRPLERLLPEMVNEIGLSSTAEELGVSKATLGYWLLKLGINVRRVALAPGETLEVKRIS